jgi:hypothetical protein
MAQGHLKVDHALELRKRVARQVAQRRQDGLQCRPKRCRVYGFN